MLFLGTDSWATFCVQHCKFGQLWKKDGFCSSRSTYSISWLCSCKIQDNKWTAVRKVFFKFSLISWHIFFFFKNHSKPVRLLSSYGLFLQTINEKFQIFRPVTELNNYNLDLHLRILGFFKRYFSIPILIFVQFKGHWEAL